MHEDVRTILLLDKTIAFLVTKPFYCSVCQSDNLLLKKSSGPKPKVATLAQLRVLTE